MKVKSLIKILQSQDQNALVILSSDAEGNSFGKLGDVTNNAVFDTETNEISGVFELTDKLIQAGFTEEDVGSGKKCIILYPN